VNLGALRFAHGDKFYPQSWFDGESFMLREPAPSEMLRGFVPARSAKNIKYLPYAATLAQLFVEYPDHEVWKDRWFWTGDFDAQGQQVYVGVRNGLFEIHRHLDTTDKWGIATWA
jgi:hypothetical protein